MLCSVLINAVLSSFPHDLLASLLSPVVRSRRHSEDAHTLVGHTLDDSDLIYLQYGPEIPLHSFSPPAGSHSHHLTGGPHLTVQSQMVMQIFFDLFILKDLINLC